MPQMAPGQPMPSRDGPVHMFPTNIAPMTSEMQDARHHDMEKDKGRARRAHHTALERKRRDHIKDMFNTLQAEVDLPQVLISRA